MEEPLGDEATEDRARRGDEVRAIAPPAPALDDRASLALDRIRWIAATMVLMTHLRSMMFVPYPECGSTHPLVRAFYAATGTGHLAVVVFFVLSGYLVGGRFVARYERGSVSIPSYLVDRIARLYVVLVPALLVTATLDAIGMHAFARVGVYDHSAVPPLGGMQYSAVDRFDATHFVANLAMLQETWTTTFGSNGPLWSLAYEFWYYLALPVLVVALDRSRSVALRTAATAGIVAAGYLLDRTLVLYASIWAIGIAVSRIRLRTRRVLPAGLVFLALAIAGRVLDARIEAMPGARFSADVVLALAFGAFLLAIVNRDSSGPSRERCRADAVDRALASSSYALYAFHAPILTFAVVATFATTGYGMRMRAEASAFATYSGFAVAILALVHVVGSRLEARTPTVRRRLRAWLGIGGSGDA